tara:strand:+ start:228 stop:677 length:450 start_codon:yes stop_codon:yes gene_type:complete
MRLRRITSIFIITIFLNGCGLSAQEWQAISDSLNEVNNALYGSNSTYNSGYSNYNNSSNSAFTKVCNYTCLGSAYSITVGSTELCPLNPPCDPSAGSASQSYTSSGSTTCFKDYEYTSGMNKVCRYDCLGQDHAITIGAAHLCPLTVKR